MTPVRENVEENVAGDGAYIRGGGVVPPGGRRLRRVLIAIGLTFLAAVTLVYAVDGAQSWLSIRNVHARGQLVQVTVTGCRGLASGTGITPVGYTCRGAFVLQGRRYNDVISGTSSRYPVGQTLTGITDPQAPDTLFTRSSVATAPNPWRYFSLPASLFGLLLVCSAVAFRARRHSK